MNLAAALQDALHFVIGSGLVRQVGEDLGTGFRSAAQHPYIGRTGTLRKAFYCSVDGAKPTMNDISGVIVFIGQDHEDLEGGPGAVPCVTIRLPNGDHITRHIDYLTLEDV